jgi:hypothetical protein
LGDIDFIEGEKRMDDVGVNFYAFTPKPTHGNSFTSIAVGLTVSIVIVVMALSILKGIVRVRNRSKGFHTAALDGHMNKPTSNSTSSMEKLTCADVDSEII